VQNVPEPVRDLLAAVLEAIDIPYPAAVGHEKAHDRILIERVMHAKIALRAVLDDRDADRAGIAWTTKYLKERLAENPPTSYVTSDQARAAVAAGKTWAEAVALPVGEGR
jgi:hypothetical protein